MSISPLITFGSFRYFIGGRYRSAYAWGGLGDLTRADADAGERYKKIVMKPEAIDQLMVDHFLEAAEQAPLQFISVLLQTSVVQKHSTRWREYLRISRNVGAPHRGIVADEIITVPWQPINSGDFRVWIGSLQLHPNLL